MFKRSSFALLLAASFVPISGGLAASSKPTVAVYSENAQSRAEQQLADALTQQLVALDKFTVIDRSHIESVQREQNYASEGQVTPATVASIGRMLGANYIIVVQVDAFTQAAKPRSDVMSFLVAQTYQTNINLSDHASLIDVRSGQIIQSISDSQQASSPAYTAQSQSSGQAFVGEEEPKILEASAEAIASKLDSDKLRTIAVEQQVAGRILSIEAGSVILSLSEKDGVAVGQMVDFYDVRTVRNPDTGAMIRAKVKRGSLQITEVDKDYSVAKSVNGHPRTNQEVRPE